MRNEKDWNASWFDQSAWVLAHLEDLHLDARESLLTLLILDANEHNLAIQPEVFAAKLKISEEEVDTIFANLSAKGYLNIDFIDGKVCFCMDGLMKNANPSGMALSKSLIGEFEDEFGRDLSVSEMDKILNLSQKFGERMLICALNEAAVYDKRNMNYIENVLISWKNKELTIEQIERGMR